jgi:2,4-dienoyl-CoA reductase-like NADH-dependent reductase (Old Yellow Enzyme family)
VTDVPALSTPLRLPCGVTLPNRILKSATIRGLNAQAQTAWYYKQILRLADGDTPDLEISAWSALTQHFRREYGLAGARRALRPSPTPP